MSLPPSKSAGHQIRRAHRAVDRTLGTALAPHGIKTGYWYYLRVLWQHDDITQKQLSDHLNVTEQTTVTMLAGLERAKLISKHKNPNDRRKTQIRLTRKGRALENKLMHLAIEINEVATEGVSARDLATCLQVLETVYGNLMLHEARPHK